MKTYLTSLFLSIVFCITGIAGIVRVPEDQPTIQAGIDAAVDGDTVLVAENTYYENISFKGKAIMVASYYVMDKDTNHINNTIINGSDPANPDSGSVVYFISGEDSTSVLKGFTVTGGKGTYLVYPPNYKEKDGAGVFIENSGAKIEKNKIIENHITVAGDTSTWGVGIIATGEIDDYIVIRGNNISENSATTTGINAMAAATIGLSTKALCVVANNRIANNACIANYRAAAGGLLIWGDYGYIGPYVVYNNIISGNAVIAPYGGGGGIWVLNASPKLTNNIISNNVTSASWGGGGILIDQQGAPGETIESVLINNTITNNTSTAAGGGIKVWGSMIRATVMNTILWGNSASSGLQIGTSNGGSITVVYSDVQNGWPGEGNIDEEPLFVTDDPLFHLSPVSSNPGINSGVDALQINGIWYYCPSYDFEGDVRPYPETVADMGVDETDVVSGIDPQPFAGIPTVYKLEQNYPNPFNPATTIEFALPKADFITLTIYDVTGAAVATLVSEQLQAGRYQYQWDAQGLASGVYFYRLEAGNFNRTKKLLLLR